MLNPNRSALEEFVRRSLATFARLLLWEPVESLRSFIEVITPCIVNKMEPELPDALRKGRVEDLRRRTLRWLERSFWDDMIHHPDDPLDKRTLRLRKLFDDAPRIPSRQGDGEHFPISVFIEYSLLFEAFKPAFKRRPPSIQHLAPKVRKPCVDDPRSRDSQWKNLLKDLIRIHVNAKRSQRWEAEQLQRAKEFGLEDHDVINLTARKAALKSLATKMDISKEAVSKLVKDGKRMLSPTVLKKLESAYANVQDNSAWQFLNQIDPLV